MITPFRDAGAQRASTGFLPAPVFAPLLADPQENRFGASLRSGEFSQRGSLEGVASFGASVPIVGFGSDSGFVMQIGIAGGAIARFDMHTSANDIVSEDYDIGFPVSLRSGRFSARLRAYHKSSHIGDEYQLNNPSFTRFDLTYEAVEGIIAGSFRSLRVYAGGDYIYHNVTTDIDPGTVRGGADFIAPGSFSIGSLDARFIAGAELKSTRDLPGRLQRAQSRGSSSRAPAVAHHRCRSCSRCSPAHPMPGSFTGPARVISA